MAISALSILPKLQTLVERPSRLIDVLREPRDLVIGSHLANKLGLQVARTCLDHALWTARRAEVPDAIRAAYDTVTRDGVVVIPDFLPEETFAQLRAEYDASREGPLRGKYSVDRFGDNLASEQLCLTDWPEHFPVACGALRDSPVLLGLASAIARRRMSFRPHMMAQYIHTPDATREGVDFNEAQYLHSDRHYPFVKAFFYLVDVDEENAPYTFVPGSHAVDLPRLKYEYELSLRISKDRERFNRRSDRDATTAALHEQVYEVATALMRERGLREVPMTGRANTLILSNNIGLHRRGDYRGNRPRISINLDYKYLESTVHHLYPILKHLPEKLVGR
jgi:hypothetical protein